MDTFVGADPTDLRLTSANLLQTAARWRDAAASVSRQIDRCGWAGRDATAFRGLWFGGLASRLDAAAEQLVIAAAGLKANADEQERASVATIGYGAPSSLFGWWDDLPWSARSAEDLNGTITVPDPASIPVDGPEADAVISDVHNMAQNRLGDCWLLATLAGVGSNDPQWINDHITFVGDGWDVTLYDNGEPVTVRVDAAGELVADGARDASGNVSWASIYEAAVAEHVGGNPPNYARIEGDFPTRALELITGSPGAVSLPYAPPAIEDLSAAIAEGRTVVGGTAPVSLPGMRDDIVTGHAYTVTTVDVPAGTVTVVNPWGPAGSEASGQGYEVTLSYEEYRRSFMTTTVGEAIG